MIHHGQEDMVLNGGSDDSAGYYVGYGVEEQGNSGGSSHGIRAVMSSGLDRSLVGDVQDDEFDQTIMRMSYKEYDALLDRYSSRAHSPIHQQQHHHRHRHIQEDADEYSEHRSSPEKKLIKKSIAIVEFIPSGLDAARRPRDPPQFMSVIRANRAKSNKLGMERKKMDMTAAEKMGMSLDRELRRMARESYNVDMSWASKYRLSDEKPIARSPTRRPRKKRPAKLPKGAVPVSLDHFNDDDDDHNDVVPGSSEKLSEPIAPRNFDIDIIDSHTRRALPIYRGPKRRVIPRARVQRPPQDNSHQSENYPDFGPEVVAPSIVKRSRENNSRSKFDKPKPETKPSSRNSILLSYITSPISSPRLRQRGSVLGSGFRYLAKKRPIVVDKSLLMSVPEEKKGNESRESSVFSMTSVDLSDASFSSFVQDSEEDDSPTHSDLLLLQHQPSEEKKDDDDESALRSLEPPLLESGSSSSDEENSVHEEKTILIDLTSVLLESHCSNESSRTPRRHNKTSKVSSIKNSPRKVRPNTTPQHVKRIFKSKDNKQRAQSASTATKNRQASRGSTAPIPRRPTTRIPTLLMQSLPPSVERITLSAKELRRRRHPVLSTRIRRRYQEQKSQQKAVETTNHADNVPEEDTVPSAAITSYVPHMKMTGKERQPRKVKSYPQLPIRDRRLYLKDGRHILENHPNHVRRASTAAIQRRLLERNRQHGVDSGYRDTFQSETRVHHTFKSTAQTMSPRFSKQSKLQPLLPRYPSVATSTEGRRKHQHVIPQSISKL